jgi:hypothetical protein
MANFDLKFNDFFNCQKAEIKKDECFNRELINIQFTTKDGAFLHPFLMDKSTAIKFAKTLRTEINKITEKEQSNG